MEFEHVVALITAPSQEAARQIVDTLLEKRLAACVNTVKKEVDQAGAA